MSAGGGRATAVLLLKLVLVPAILAGAWFWARHEGVSIAPKGPWWLLAAALAINQVGILLIGVRMHAGLRLFGIDLPSIQALRIGTQSQFYFFFVPLSAGNEVSRFMKIRALRPETPTHSLVVSLLLDRVTGLVACLALALGSLPLLARQPIAGLKVPPMAVAGGAAALLAAAVVVAWKLGWLSRVAEAWRETRGRRHLLVPVSAWVLCMQACTILAVGAAARWLGIQVAPEVLVFGISAATLGQVIPVTLAGAGPAEAAGVAVFLATGMEAADAGTLAALIYLTRLMAALEGGAWEMAEGLRVLMRRGHR